MKFGPNCTYFSFPSMLTQCLLLISLFNEVTMQAQRSAPLDMHCKDKFLIQSTVAPFGTSEEDIVPGLVRVCALMVSFSSYL